jgi:hypothetical protein
MAAVKRSRTGQAQGRENSVSDEEVAEAIMLFGGDPHEAVRALVGALHHLVSRGYTRGTVSLVGASAGERADGQACVH